MALEITTRETREIELNGRVERRNSTIQQLKRELKEAKSVQSREEGEITSVEILESGKKRKAECSDGGKRPELGKSTRSQTEREAGRIPPANQLSVLSLSEPIQR